MTDLTARQFREQGVPQVELDSLFALTGNLKPMIEATSQKIGIDALTIVSEMSLRVIGSLEVSVPLSSIQFSPLTRSEFAAELAGAKVWLPEPWSASAAGQVEISDGKLKLHFDDANMNVMKQAAPVVHLRMPSGQLVLLELQPRLLRVDSRAAEIAWELAQVADIEAQILQLEAEGAFPANIDFERDSVAWHRAAAEELRTRDFVGLEVLPDHGG